MQQTAIAVTFINDFTVLIESDFIVDILNQNMKCSTIKKMSQKKLAYGVCRSSK